MLQYIQNVYNFSKKLWSSEPLHPLRILTARHNAVGIAPAGSEPQKPQFFIFDVTFNVKD